jgi:hypothetical protein
MSWIEMEKVVMVVNADDVHLHWPPHLGPALISAGMSELGGGDRNALIINYWWDELENEPDLRKVISLGVRKDILVLCFCLSLTA